MQGAPQGCVICRAGLEAPSQVEPGQACPGVYLGVLGVWRARVLVQSHRQPGAQPHLGCSSKAQTPRILLVPLFLFSLLLAPPFWYQLAIEGLP